MEKEKQSSKKFTLRHIGLSRESFSMMSAITFPLSGKILCKIYDMNIAELTENFEQAGLYSPFINPQSIEGFQYSLLWLYLSGKIKYELSSEGKAIYLKKNIEDKGKLDYEEFSLLKVMQRMLKLMNFSEEYLWMFRCMAEQLINGDPDTRRDILADFLHQKNTICREDYKVLDDWIDLEKFKERGRKYCWSKAELYNIFDLIKIGGNHFKIPKTTFKRMLIGRFPDETKHVFYKKNDQNERFIYLPYTLSEEYTFVIPWMQGKSGSFLAASLMLNEEGK